MKTFKRIAAVAAAIAMLCTMLTGCNDDSAKNDGITTITVWSDSTHTKDLATELVDKFNSTTGKKKGIRIEYSVYGSDYTKVLDVSQQTGSMPDLFYPSSGIQDLVKKDCVAAIDDMPGGKEFLKKYKGMLRAGANSIDGKTYCVPHNLTTVGLIYNKDLFKANGIVDKNGEAKAPTTWDEVREYAKKCTNPEKKVYGIALPLKWGGYLNWDLLHPWFSSLGTEGYDYEAGKYDYTALKPAFDWFMQIKKDGSAFFGAEGLDNDPARAQFAAGRIAMKFAASWDVGVLNDQFPTECDWGVAPVPGIDGAPKYKQFSTNQPLLAISKSGAKKDNEKLMEVYKWFHGDEYLIEMYENGKFIPADASIIEKAKLPDNAAKGWKEFCEFSDISVALPLIPTGSLEGDNLSALMLKMWMGEVKVDDALEDITKRMNKAIDKEKERGTLDYDLYQWGDVSKER